MKCVSLPLKIELRAQNVLVNKWRKRADIWRSWLTPDASGKADPRIQPLQTHGGERSGDAARINGTGIRLTRLPSRAVQCADLPTRACSPGNQG